MKGWAQRKKKNSQIGKPASTRDPVGPVKKGRNKSEPEKMTNGRWKVFNQEWGGIGGA